MNVKFKHGRLYLKLATPFMAIARIFVLAQFARASGCKSHSYAIKQIYGRSQPPFLYTAVANIRKTLPCLKLDIQVAMYMPSRCLRVAMLLGKLIDTKFSGVLLYSSCFPEKSERTSR